MHMSSILHLIFSKQKDFFKQYPTMVFKLYICLWLNRLQNRLWYVQSYIVVKYLQVKEKIRQIVNNRFNECV